jgi:hypothetical protein
VYRGALPNLGCKPRGELEFAPLVGYARSNGGAYYPLVRVADLITEHHLGL